MDGDGRQRAANVFEIRHTTPASCDVAALGGVDGKQVAVALAVLRILSVGNEHLVFPDHRRGDDIVAGARPLGAGRVGVELPEHGTHPLAASNPRTQPSPWPMTTWHDAVRSQRPRASTIGRAEYARRAVPPAIPARRCGLLTAIRSGACGAGTRPCSSCPFDVLTISRSPYDCRRAARHVVRKHTELAGHVVDPHDVSVYVARARSAVVSGPSFSPSRKPSVSSATISPRLLT